MDRRQRDPHPLPGSGGRARWRSLFAVGSAALSDSPHIVRKRLAAGVAWYVYAWRGGPQVLRSEGPQRPKLTTAVLKAIVEAQEGRAAPDELSLRSLIRAWRSLNPDRRSSPDWEKLALTTQKTWGSALDRIDDKWGDVPLRVFNDPRMKAMIVKWRDSRIETPRAADIGVTVLSALLRFGLLRGKVSTNVAAGIPSLYTGGDRSEIIWTDQDVKRFVDRAEQIDARPAADALRLAVLTGLRREDLTTLKWDQINEWHIVKKALKRSRGRRHFANVVRIPELDDLLVQLEGRYREDGVQTVLVDNRGRSWTPDRLTKAIHRVRDDLGIVHIDEETGVPRSKHLHDARGTFATKLMMLGGLTDQDIAEAMAWSPQRVSHIRRVYVDQRAVTMALGQRIRAAV